MKQQALLTTLLLFIVCNFYGYSQKVEGIGKFKINKTTTSIISDFEIEKKGKPIEIMESPDYSTSINEEALYFLKPDTSFQSDFNENYYVSFCKKAKTFFMKKYFISDVLMENVYLTFYNDTLIEFRASILAEYDKIQEIVKLKYGTPDKTDYLPGYYKFMNDFKRKGIQPTKEDIATLKKTYHDGDYWYNKDITLYVGGGMKFFQFSKGKYQDVAVEFSIVVRDSKKINALISCSELLRKKYLNESKLKLKNEHKDF